MVFTALAAAAISFAAQSAPAESVRLLRVGSIPSEMNAGDVRHVTLALRRGESAEVEIVQEGIDVSVEIFSPSGRRLDLVDNPNGRQGPEPVSLLARETGTYRLEIRPIAANEPAGRILINLVALRDGAVTARLMAERRRARDAAAAWLRRQDSPLPANGIIGPDAGIASFDALAAGATILGLGEASHGSRELNDLRLALVQRLVVRHGYRLIALEDSASRWRALDAYVAGTGAAPAGEPLEWGWIGRRSRRDLLDWARQWNLQHPGDRVRIVGVDAQDNRADRALLAAFLGRAYGAGATQAWTAQETELAAADEQTAVFGDSGTTAALRQFLQEIVAQLTADGPLLRARFGDASWRAALEAGVNLAAFADFNSGGGAIGHSRDWTMAAAIVRAMDQAPAPQKTVYWGHNSHVSAAATRWGPTGALLRQAFGCSYRAVATTFGAGDLIAQIPNDLEDRILATTLPPPEPEDEVTENVLASVRSGAHVAAWGCGAGAGDVPAWLTVDRPMRWIGGLYAPDSPASASYRPYRLVTAFDAIAYFPRVTAEPIPAGRPIIPPRRRP